MFPDKVVQKLTYKFGGIVVLCQEIDLQVELEL